MCASANTGWKQIAHTLALQFTDRRDPFLEDWWNHNLHLRRGGFDRMLLLAPFSPDDAALTREGVKARLFLHEIVHVPFGEARPYLAELERTFLPAAKRHGWQLIGAYRVALRPREVLTIWGLRDWADLAAPLTPDEPDLRAWLDYRNRTVTCSEELILLPARLNPLGLQD
jgi:hypothetical protein